MVDSGANECRQRKKSKKCTKKEDEFRAMFLAQKVKGCKKGNARKESLLFGMTIQRAGGCMKQ